MEPYFLEMTGKIYVFMKVGDNLKKGEVFLFGETPAEAQKIYDDFTYFLNNNDRPGARV